jgi:hypothetical protein
MAAPEVFLELSELLGFTQVLLVLLGRDVCLILEVDQGVEPPVLSTPIFLLGNSRTIPSADDSDVDLRMVKLVNGTRLSIFISASKRLHGYRPHLWELPEGGERLFTLRTKVEQRRAEEDRDWGPS